MRSLIALSLLLLTVPGFSQASVNEIYSMKHASCASGELNPKGTLEIGSKYSLQTLIDIRDGAPAEYLVVGDDLVLSVYVTGELGGACWNNNQPTVLTLTFQRGQK